MTGKAVTGLNVEPDRNEVQPTWGHRAAGLERKAEEWLSKQFDKRALFTKIILLILAAPIIVILIASSVQHAYFRDLYEAPETSSWLAAVPSACGGVLATSGLWVRFICGGRPEIAPFAGIQLPESEREAESLKGALDQLWELAKDANPSARPICSLVRVRSSNHEESPLSSWQFANCTIGDQSVSRMLISLGAPAAPKDSPSFRALYDLYPEGNRANKAISAKTSSMQEARRTTALGTQTWVATILGFFGAAFGLIEVSHARAKNANAQKDRLRERLHRSLVQFVLFEHVVSAAAKTDDIVWKKAQHLLLTLRVNLLAYIDSDPTKKAAGILEVLDIIEIYLGKSERPPPGVYEEAFKSFLEPR